MMWMPTCIHASWVLLLLAIAAEVIGTSCLKLSDGFSRLWPSVVVLLAYSTSMLLLSQVVKTIPLGITYAMWSGIGIVAIVLVGVLAYRQTPTAMQLFGMALIAAGVVTVNVSGLAMDDWLCCLVGATCSFKNYSTGSDFLMLPRSKNS